MMQLVVTQGTGKAAALDFTNVAGKTGTSSNYKDAWFVGFTGKYVASIWLGNDDNRPMLNVTGGHGPAPAWHSFMSVVHTSMNIPMIPGLPPHPTQIQEQQRIADLQRSEPPSAATAIPGDGPKRSASLMPDPTREALKKLALAMRKAGGASDTTPPASPPAPAAPVPPAASQAPAAAAPPAVASPAPPPAARPAVPPGRRADQAPSRAPPIR